MPGALQQAQAYDANGAPIAPEDTAAAVREGRGFFQKSAQVYALNPEGNLVTVSGEEAGMPGYKVLGQGDLHQQLLKRDAESVGGMAKTAGEGLARGATLGFAAPELFYDKEGREAALARKTYNPNLSTGSEIAGALGATVAAEALSGGAASGGVGARLAALAGRGALTPFRAALALGELAEGGAAALGAGEGIIGTGLRLGARGMAEGALMGVGHEVSQTALEDVPLTAERLLAGAWDGAKMGGVFGAGMGVLGAGVGKAGRAILGKMTNEGEDLGSALSGWAEKRAFKQAVGNNGKIFDRASNFGADMARPQRICRKLLDAGVESEGGTALRQVKGLADEAAARLGSVAQEMDAAGVVADTGKILGTIDDQIAKIRETPIGDFQAVADRVEKQIAPFRAKMTPVEGVANDTVPSLNFSELWTMRQNLDKTLKWEQKARGPAEEALRDMVSAFRSELDDSIGRAAESGAVSPELQGAWRKATEDYSDFALARDGLKDLIKRESKNRWMSASDYGTGGAAGMLVGILSGNPIAGAVTSAATGAVHKLLRERGAGVVARIADRAASVAGRMETAAKVAAMVEKPKAIALPASINVAQQFKHYSDLVRQAEVEPAKFAQRIGDATADLNLRAPEVASKIQETLIADLTYLRNLHPKASGRVNQTMTPMAVKTEYYAFDQKKAFVQAATALDNPLGVFDSLAKGDLPLAGLNALKERRPELFGQMRQTVVKYTMTRQEELPFNRRMLLGVAFDFPSDWSMGHIDAIQQSLAAGNKQESPHAPTAAPSKINTDPGAGISPGQF